MKNVWKAMQGTKQPHSHQMPQMAETDQDPKEMLL